MKLVILAMSCNLPFFIKEENLVKETWANKVINNLYNDVKFYFIRSDENERIENEYIYVNTSDAIEHTMQKTIRAFELLKENNIEYDFILRTNLSTYIVIDNVLTFMNNDLINNFQQYSNTLFTSEVVSAGKLEGPRGNFMLMNKGIANSLVYLFRTYYNDQIGLDDAIIGTMLYPAVTCRVMHHGEMFKDLRYHKDTYIGDVSKLDKGFFFVSYRYYSDSMAVGYTLREQIEFSTCRQIHAFYSEQTSD